MTGGGNGVNNLGHLSETARAAETQNQRLVARMLLEGYRPAEIAASLGLGERTVKRMAKVLNGRWQRDADSDYKGKVARELANIKQLEQEAKEAWRRSQEPALVHKTTKARRKVSEATDLSVFAAAEGEAPADVYEMVVVEETTELRAQAGDPRFLDLARSCAVEQLKVMGAYRDEGNLQNVITAEQMMEFARAFMEAARQEVGDEGVIRRLQAKTVRLLPGGAAAEVEQEESGESERGTEPMDGDGDDQPPDSPPEHMTEA